MTSTTILLPFQPATMSTAQLAAVSFLARYAGHTPELYAFQLRQWFAWCETNQLDPLLGIQRAHVELYIRYLAERGLMDSSVVTMMHGVRGYFRFAHIASKEPATVGPWMRDNFQLRGDVAAKVTVAAIEFHCPQFTSLIGS